MSWEFFDEDLFDEECGRLNVNDRRKLIHLMDLYLEHGNQRPAFIEDYGDGLFCLRHSSGAYKGRCLFFKLHEAQPIALLVYRKESNKADPRAIEKALNRKKEFESRK